MMTNTVSLTEKNMDNFENCSSYFTRRGYTNEYTTKDELNFPVAYSCKMVHTKYSIRIDYYISDNCVYHLQSIVAHDNFGQLERLIRSIWRPQERYTTDHTARCIHNIC